ncbi:putative glycosyltransferase EpsE [Novipirellula aureliae]|uniref:Putative glycosyltransferase EpsE n=1 Tax=Novipirellula aureliae TaxID=2527966 RepID=A0A5C6DUZ9_9BACT|nr:putative glycosyltransferase EpsE [Novipirellula aureliae]
MNPETPLVSVLMPVRDTEQYVGLAISSILTQSFSEFEFLIIDDGSSDQTPALLKHAADQDHRIRLITQATDGVRVALSRGLESARGQYIARMDADDIALPDRLEKQVTYLDSHPGVVGVGGQTWAIDSDDLRLFPIELPTDPEAIEQSLLSGKNCISNPTTMLRRRAVQIAGGYKDEYPTDDYGLWLRLLEVGPLHNQADFVLEYRLHAAQTTLSKHQSQLTAAHRIVNEARERRGLPLLAELPPDHSPASIARIHHHWAMSAAQSGQWKAARKHAKYAITMEPANLHAWWTMFKGCFHLRLRQRQPQ